MSKHKSLFWADLRRPDGSQIRVRYTYMTMCRIESAWNGPKGRKVLLAEEERRRLENEILAPDPTMA
jgi:hypothetical protein